MAFPPIIKLQTSESTEGELEEEVVELSEAEGEDEEATDCKEGYGKWTVSISDIQ